MKARGALAVIVTAAALAAAAVPVRAQAPADPDAPRAVEADGVATIVAGDLARARDEALLDAYRRALETAEVRVHSRTQTRNFQVLIDEVSAGGTGYLTALDVTGERVDGPLYRLHVRATAVPAGGLPWRGQTDAREALAVLLGMMDRPTVAVGVGGPEPYAGLAETALAAQFARAGYQVVQRTPALDAAVAALATDTDRRRTVLTSTRAAADIVIAGTVDAAPLGEVRIDTETSESAEAALRVRVMVGATGQTLFAGIFKTPALHVTPDAAMRQASRAAGERAGARLIWDVAREYATLIRGNRSVQVVVFARDLGRVSTLVARMREIRGVDGRAYLRRYEGGVGVIDVTSSFPMRTLVPRLEALGLHAVAAEANRVVLESR
ncbi:MAG TPA: hypothetical protein VGX97_04535 [bacterium]|nr:hypothetical protein [bacterium]